MRKFLLILAGAIIVMLALLVWFYPSSEDFRSDNPFWNGLKAFSEQSGSSLLESLDDLPLKSEGSALLLVPYVQFTDTDLRRVSDYLSGGGTLIVMDDFGYGNQVLEYLGLDQRLTQDLLADPLFNYRNEVLPKIVDFAPVAIMENVDSIVLNHATTLSGASESEVVAWSSRFSYLDLNGDGTWQQDEPKGPFPVAAAAQAGGGYIVVVADPSILINSMEGMGDNYTFVEGIAEIQGPQPKILIDQSHLPEASLDEAKGFLTTVRERLASPIGMSILVALILVVILGPLWRRA